MFRDKNKQIFPFDCKTKHLKLDHIDVGLPRKKEPRNEKKKRANTLGSCHKEQLNRSTITSFYQLEDKKKRMLDKLRLEKERIHELKLSEAFFVTKYAEKFRVNSRHAC